MEVTINNNTHDSSFIDRRGTSEGDASKYERRQFASSHDGLSDDARDLALAIDSYKLKHRRRYITFEEMLGVVKNLGYEKVQPETR